VRRDGVVNRARARWFAPDHAVIPARGAKLRAMLQRRRAAAL